MSKRITITLQYQGRELDADVPSETPIRLLEEPLAALLSEGFGAPELMWQRLFLEDTSGCLNPVYSLSDYGVQQGSRLILRMMGVD